MNTIITSIDTEECYLVEADRPTVVSVEEGHQKLDSVKIES